MSLKALIDAAEYVDKDSQNSEEHNHTSESTPASATGQRNLSGDSTIKHWRKIAVAQSVKELSCKTSEQSSDHVSFQDAINCNGISFQDSQSVKNDTTTFQKDLRLQEHSTSAPLQSSRGSILDDHFNSFSMNSEDAVTLSSNAHPSPPPLPTPRKSTASSPHGTIISADNLPGSPRLPHNFSNASLNFRQDHGDGSGSEISGNFGWPDGTADGLFGTLKKRHGSVTREAHNQLEKSRRKHLKQCYEGLRSVMPNLGPKTSHLIILREAIKCIQILEERHRNLREHRFALAEENMMKQKRLRHLKEQVSKYIGHAELEKLLINSSKSTVEESMEEEDNLLGNSSSMQQGLVPATTNQGTSNSWIQKKQMYAPINGFVPVHPGSTFPPLSSTMNLVNEARRLCTVLPSLRVMTSSEVQKNSRTSNAKPAGTFYQPINYPSAVRLSTPFLPNPATSPYTNVRAYTGFGVPQGSNFMQASPLKIFVKQVDSAKQQARVSRPPPTSDSTMKRPSITEQSFVSKNSEARVSSVPSSPSRHNSVFSRIQGRDIASPPLLSTNLGSSEVESSNASKETNGNARGFFTERKAPYCRPRSKSDIEDLSDDSDDMKRDMTDIATTGAKQELIYIPPKKRRSGSAYETFPSNSWKFLSRKRLRRKSLRENSITHRNDIQKTADSPIAASPSAKSGIDKGHPATTSLPVLKVPAPIAAVSNLVNPNDSLTKVSFTTLNSAKPAVPSVNILVKQQDSGKSPSGNNSPANSTLPSNGKINNNIDASSNLMPRLAMPQNMVAISMAQNIVPVMMPFMASPSMGFMMPPKSVDINPTPSVRPAISAATQTIAPSNTSNMNVQRADAESQTCTMKPQVPQFQCMMPMAFPGMMTGSNCSPMMMQAPMSGFFPMMPQGQGWGFMMPQGMMMMATTNQKSTNTEPKNSDDNKALSQIETIQSSNLTNEKRDSVTTSAGPASTQSSPPSSPSSSKIANSKPIATGMCQVPQQFPMMPNYQTAGQYMMSMQTGQSGGFYFGGPSTMMPAPGQTVGYPMPMNVVGFPMQFGGSNSFQFAFPSSNFNAPAQQTVMQRHPDGPKPNVTDSSNRSSDKG